MSNAERCRRYRESRETMSTWLAEKIQSLTDHVDMLGKQIQRLIDHVDMVPPSPLNSPLDGSPCTPSLIPPIIPPSNVRAIEADFDLWWDEYPHKVGKGAARTKYRVARTKTSADVLLNALRRYKTTKPVEQPWCNPATWLNQERWLDAPAANGHVNGSAALAVRTPSSKCSWPACSCQARSQCPFGRYNGELHV